MSKWFRWLERLGVDPALVGDLNEEYRSGRSTVWLLWQSFTATVLAKARTSSRRFEFAFLKESEMKDLFDFLLAPARRVPWSVATAFGVVLVLIMVAGKAVVPHVFVYKAGVAACFAPGLVGASRGREFDQGILAVFAAIVIAFVIGAGALIATSSMNALVPLPAMLLLGLPVGTLGAGVGAWFSHRASLSRLKT